MKLLSIIVILICGLSVFGQTSDAHSYRGKIVAGGVAPYINTEYNFTVKPPPETTPDEEFNKKANFLATYSCKAPACVVHGFFSIAMVKPMNATRTLVTETFQKESARDKMVSLFIKNAASNSEGVILSNKYVEINGRPSVRINYSFTKNAVPLINTLTVVFVEEKKIIVAFGSLAESSQVEKWNKTSEEAIRSFTLLPDKHTPAIELYGKGDVVKASPLYVGDRILNYDATSLPKPVYPPAALAVRASGVVTVKVTVDSEGNVTSATAESGHPLLQLACEKAALQAKFKSSVASSGKLTGIIIYNFVAPPLSKTKDN